MKKILKSLPSVSIAIVFTSAVLLNISKIAYSQDLAPTSIPEATQIGNPLPLAPEPRVRVVFPNVNFRIKDLIRNTRNYFIVIIDDNAETLFSRTRIRSNGKIGKLKVKDFPCGKYRAYTLVKTKNRKFETIQVHSEAVAFEVLQCPQVPEGTPTATATPTLILTVATPTTVPTATVASTATNTPTEVPPTATNTPTATPTNTFGPV
jgi:hypothetical protein